MPCTLPGGGYTARPVGLRTGCSESAAPTGRVPGSSGASHHTSHDRCTRHDPYTRHPYTRSPLHSVDVVLVQEIITLCEHAV
eukprot:scaffold6493_cov54-Phaeocystis_antarctica.AAC.2